MSSERLPVRPSIPVGAWPAAGVWVGVWVAESCTWARWAGGGHDSLWAAFVVGCAISAAAAWRAKRTALALVGIAIIAGFLTGAAYWGRWASDVDALREARSSRVRLEARTDPVAGTFGTKQEAVLLDGPAPGSRVSASWPKDARPPEFGYTATGYARYKPPQDDKWGRLAHRDGGRGALVLRRPAAGPAAHSLSGFVAPLRRHWHERLSALDGPGVGILDGVLIGDCRRLVGTQTDAALRTCGLTHLVAVSGGHLVVVAGLVATVLGATSLPRSATAVAVTVVCGLYVLASGVQPSAVRAFVMACVACLASLSDRRTDAGAALCATVCGCLLLDPPLAFDLGFTLSTLAVAGLVLFAQLAEAWIAPMLPRAGRSTAGALGMTLVAQATTLPVTVPVFGTLSVIAPVANIPAAFLISFALPAGLLGLLVADISPTIGMLVLRFAETATRWCSYLAERLAALPGASIPLTMRADAAGIAVLVTLVVVWAVWPRPNRARSLLLATLCALMVFVVVVGPRGPAGLEIRVLDVGQGDAILVRDGGHSLLVDTGPSDTALRQALARCGVRHLDYLLLTHGHEDHAGALGALSGLVRVDNALLSEAESRGKLQRDVAEVAGEQRAVVAGDEVALGGTNVRVVSPPAGVDPEGNDGSLVVDVEKAGFHCVLTGDAESGVLDELVRSHAEGDIDVLKVGHHGSASAVSNASLAALKPEIALISVGAGNRFGHPTRSTLALLQDHGVEVLRTDLLGDLVVRVRDDGRYRVEAARGGAGERAARSGADERSARGAAEEKAASPHQGTRDSYGTRTRRYATLFAAVEHLENRGQPRRRTTQTRLPHLRYRGDPPGAGPRPPPVDGRRGRRSRLQLRHIRRGDGECGCDRCGRQYAAVRLRAPPGGRP